MSRIRFLYLLCIFAFFVFVAVSCSKMLPGLPEPQDILAEPVPGLTPEQMNRHIVGDEEFAHVFSSAEGLGPIFVSNSCEGCHIGDGKGHPVTTLTRFGKWDGTTFDPLLHLGGPQLQERAIAGFPAELVPSEATGQTRIMPPAVTGLGYLEAIPDSAILNLADSADADGDGISGIPSWVAAPEFFQQKPHHQPQNGKFIGRFGKKAGAIDLRMQTVGAYINDMGITSDFHLEDLFNVQVSGAVSDDVPDPEVSGSTVDNVVFYLQTLKVPPRRDENAAEVVAGEMLFTQIGCAKCHTPTFTTGDSDIEALAHKEIHPYTDLLLHDMGAALNDGYTEGSATLAEWRTPPLWGIGLAADSQGGIALYLHDGRASTLDDAITLHGGEGQASADAYNALSQAQKDQLIAFLKSL